MKLARFTSPDGQARYGVVTETDAIALDGRVASFATLLEDPTSRRVRPDDARWPVSSVRWESPIESTAKVVCVGLSYAAHATETARKPVTHVGRGFEVNENMTLFLRFPDSFVGSGHPVIRPFDSDSLDWEGEIAIAIGRGGRRIPEHAALEHIAGYTCMAENSVREWQAHSAQATAGKNWSSSGACGPWVVTADEVGAEPMTIRTLLNGVEVQSDTTDNLSISFAEMVSYISAFTTLRPGDVIATGTPAGIGYRQDPPRYLRPGDELAVEVPRVGTLRHTVVDESQAV